VFLIDLTTAFMLLTRLPVARFARAGNPDLARCVWAFPIVGLVVNGIGGLVFWLGHKAGLASPPAAVWALAATMLATGALHEDGLADAADGLGGGATPARRLEIMRDSRIGSYGALALVLSVLIRTAAIAAPIDPARVIACLIAAGMLGRAGMAALLALLRPAQEDGMGAAMGAARPMRVAAGIGLASIGCLLALPTTMALVSIAAAFCVVPAVAWLVHRRIGGYTGDVLGACEVVIECVVLSIVTSMGDVN
jgi:adenosylcobinamide-GDP ribazoletransferase